MTLWVPSMQFWVPLLGFTGQTCTFGCLRWRRVLQVHGHRSDTVLALRASPLVQPAPRLAWGWCCLRAACKA